MQPRGPLLSVSWNSPEPKKGELMATLARTTDKTPDTTPEGLTAAMDRARAAYYAPRPSPDETPGDQLALHLKVRAAILSGRRAQAGTG